MILQKEHNTLTNLEKEEGFLFAELEDAQFNLKIEEANILLNTTKEDWKNLGITNETGRKAYLTKRTGELLNRVKELKKELKYNQLKQNRCKRMINYYMGRDKL